MFDASRDFANDMIDPLREAAARLGLGAPSLDPADGPTSLYVCRGTIDGFEVELGIGGRGWHEVRVRLVVVDLPRGIGIGPRPTGPGVEDYYLGVAVGAGEPPFDQHFAFFGSSGCVGEALRVAVATVPRRLVDFVAERFDPSFDLGLTASQLRLTPGEPTLLGTAAGAPRWRARCDDLVACWHHARRLVSSGLMQGVFAEAAVATTMGG
ncbi:MAG: hypothetical protein NT062_17960 [Proteobacteria bacterium]|nr:hypothetical protein [Pseudomonadota bacterium]